MEFAQIGPLTAAVEALAAVVGAGVLLGGFVVGAARFFTGSSRQALEVDALRGGYWGGAISFWLALADVIVRYS